MLGHIVDMHTWTNESVSYQEDKLYLINALQKLQANYICQLDRNSKNT